MKFSCESKTSRNHTLFVRNNNPSETYPFISSRHSFNMAKLEVSRGFSEVVA